MTFEPVEVAWGHLPEAPVVGFADEDGGDVVVVVEADLCGWAGAGGDRRVEAAGGVERGERLVGGGVSP
jgi:hypothetical protein